MSLRKSPAGNLKKGNYFMVGEGAAAEPCMVLGTEHSKSGKHGHAKNRVSCVGLFDKKKRSLVFSSGGMVDIPEINKRSGQITNITEKTVVLMDLESFEEIEAIWPIDSDVDIKKLKQLMENIDDIGDSQVEYWDVVGRKIITRVMIQK
ncbi:MAG: translation initiation factor IF-5A [archaeon]|nr:translation initiation factor IF-5A [archaeon]